MSKIRCKGCARVKAVVLSLAPAIVSSEAGYYEHLKDTLQESEADLAVLPAYTSLLFALGCSKFPGVHHFTGAVHAARNTVPENNDAFFDVHARLAETCGCYLVPGTFFETAGEELFYHSAPLLDPQGRLLGIQRQTHLSSEEKTLGLSRGTELTVFDTPIGKLAIVVGTDAWYPEASRILALQGAEIVCHPGALPHPLGPWHQLSGMWKEVQQNQFFCLESQLFATLWERSFSGQLAIHAPCEMTPDQSGYLAKGEAGKAVLTARLDREKRAHVIKQYPLLGLLNPQAYQPYIPGMYCLEKQEKQGKG